MNPRILAATLSTLLVCVSVNAGQPTLEQQNEQMFQQMQQERGVTPQQMEKRRTIFPRSGFMCQGNPAISVHAVTKDECRKKLQQRQVSYANRRLEKICGAKYMALLYNPKKTTAEHAKVCIDQFEYPNMPCAYPVVWVKAREAAQ
jgi:hypothetical protein